MSANVYHLPDAGHRAWCVYERDLRAGLLRDGVGPDLVDHALGAVKPSFLAAYAARPVDLRVDGPDGLAEVSKWVYSLGSTLLAALVTREMELYLLRGSASTLPG